MVDPGAIDRWMAHEMGGLAKSMVAGSRILGDLLLEDEPAATTRGGDPHVYDKAALRALAERLGPLARRRLKIPVTFWVDKDVSDDAYVQDESAADALRRIGVVPEDREMRGGKLWLSLALAHETAAKYPTVFQFVHF